MSARHLEITLNVNGEPVAARVEARRTLVDFLREDLALTGSHVGCEHGVCGACTVLLNGEVVRGCLTFAVQCDGADVETIEGLSDSGAIADLQRAFQERNALQCGYCTPGILISARELLASGVAPSRETIREHLSGHYCRCTGYQAIVDAIEAVVAYARFAPPPRAGEVASEASRKGQ
jgi:carbon-monoxide dehydrogenase small subunit